MSCTLWVHSRSRICFPKYGIHKNIWRIYMANWHKHPIITSRLVRIVGYISQSERRSRICLQKHVVKKKLKHSYIAHRHKYPTFEYQHGRNRARNIVNWEEGQVLLIQFKQKHTTHTNAWHICMAHRHTHHTFTYPHRYLHTRIVGIVSGTLKTERKSRTRSHKYATHKNRRHIYDMAH